MITIQLVDRNKEMCEEWKLFFDSYPNVEIIHGDFFSVKTDCIVSPGNSFGFMDGGLDLVISKKLGWGIQTNLQKILRSEYNGELLVGQALLLETENKEIPYCIAAPTMRVPSHLKDSVNVYLAAKAIFKILKENTVINTVTISGLGTGVGQLPYEICARQMYIAYKEIMLNIVDYPKTWYQAQQHHQLLFQNTTTTIYSF